MHIHWFPGHMTKAIRMIEENLRLVDGIVIVLDSRAPRSSLNPAAEKWSAIKPCLYVLNKADMCEQEATKNWIGYFAKQNKPAISFNATKTENRKIIIQELKKLAESKCIKYAKKGVVATVRMMILGVPNSGKSTLINNITGSAKTVTGDRPGVTRGKQWIRVEQGIELLDTPGVLPPNMEDQKSARHLAYIGSVKDDILDVVDLAIQLISDLKNICPHLLIERYGGDKTASHDSPERFFESICLSRGCIGRAGVIDSERGAKLILDDFRKGRIGKICLDVL